MLSLKRRLFFLPVYQEWFHFKFRITDILGLKACLYVKEENLKFPFLIKKTVYSIENSLEHNVEDIFASFSSSNRTKIRKAEREGIQCCFDPDIDQFIEFYNKFCSNNTACSLNRKKLDEWGDHLRMSIAMYDGQILAAHSFIVDRRTKIVRGIHSATARYDNNKISHSITGRANKILHFKDMVYFKSEGIKTYDWGGYAMETKDKKLMGINNFKLSFGGNIVSYTNYYTVGYFWLSSLAHIFHFYTN